MNKNIIKACNKSRIKKSISYKLPKHLEHINKMAAGIDVGSKSHFVAVPNGCDKNPVREFKSFTSDLHKLADWLKKCKITTIAMESTGVYWIPIYELLEEKGFEVRLVDARHVKNVSGRKTDVSDCQWLQQLHTYGLLKSAFRPDGQVCELRAYLRQRSMLIGHMSSNILHMQKALDQMNVHLHNVISDITGETGIKILRAIVGGERNVCKLAEYRHKGCKNSIEVITKSLEGNYKNEHVFSLKQALELYDYYQEKIKECEIEIEKILSKFETKAVREENKDDKGYGEGKDDRIARRKKSKTHSKNKIRFDVTGHLKRICGVDLTRIPGIEASTALKVISEIGTDMSRWKNSKQFASWLGLCPGNKVSGGKVLSSRSKRSNNYAALGLRLAANTLHNSQTALGAFFRRIKSRLGGPKAITAGAHKIAQIIYRMLSTGREYVEMGQSYYEEKYKERIVKNLRQRAKSLGFALITVSEDV